jgi:hypothetical protein
MDMFSIATGAVGVGVAYFLYLVSSKGLPAALGWVKARWNAGKLDLEQIKGDVGEAHLKISSLEGRLRESFASVYAEIDELKVKAGLSPGPSAAPADDSAAAARVQPKAPAFLEGQS